MLIMRGPRRSEFYQSRKTAVKLQPIPTRNAVATMKRIGRTNSGPTITSNSYWRRRSNTRNFRQCLHYGQGSGRAICWYSLAGL